MGPLERRPAPLGARGGFVLLCVFAGLSAAIGLGLTPAGLLPSGGGAAIARDFAAAALRPALDYEADWVPAGAPPFLLRLAGSLWRTLVYAAAAMSIALPAGLCLGFLGSSSWWADGEGRRSVLAPLAQAAVRLFVALMRSVHELLWAVVLLAAMGPAPVAGVIALAVPYAGILAKVFSELLDEAPDDSARALRAAGAAPVQVFLFGRLPRALPDMAAYAFYRFECSVRSAAVLGFFGLPTLGYHLRQSFDSLHHREVWSHLYALFFLVALLELWSGVLRRRFVA